MLKKLTITGILTFLSGSIGGYMILYEPFNMTNGMLLIMCFVAVIVGGVLVPLSATFSPNERNDKIVQPSGEKQ